MVKKLKNILILLGILICGIVILILADVNAVIRDVDYSYYLAILVLIILIGARGVFAIYELEKTTKRAIEEVEKAKDTIRHPSDSSWIYENLISRAKICIYKFNEALENKDASIAKGYISESLEEELKAKINNLIEKNQKQVLENYKIIKLLPIKAIDELNDDEDLIKIAVQVEAFNYIIDEDNNIIINEENISLKTSEKTWTYIKKNGFWIADKVEAFNLEIDEFI